MPTRIIRPEILTSDSVDKLNWQQEVFYRRLLSIGDDYGLYDARIPLLRAALFPLRLDRVSDRDVQGYHDRLVELGLVKVYTVEGRMYGQIVKYGQQSKSEPKFPLPPWADPAEYRPARAEKEKKNNNPSRAVTSRNEPLRAAPMRHLVGDEVEDEVGGGETRVRAQVPPPASGIDGMAYARWVERLRMAHPSCRQSVQLSNDATLAAMNAFVRCPHADEHADLLCAYYASSLQEDRNRKAFWRPEGQSMFFDKLEDVLTHALRWKKETGWGVKRRKVAKGAPKADNSDVPTDEERDAILAEMRREIEGWYRG